MRFTSVFFGVIWLTGLWSLAQQPPTILPSSSTQPAFQANEPSTQSSAASTNVSAGLPAASSAIVEPGWRPSPNPASFPLNPFSTGAVVISTPRFYEQEAKALSERILGLMRIGEQYALLMDNQLIRQGMKVPAAAPSKVSKKEKASSIVRKSSNESTMSPDPKTVSFIFSGVTKDQNYAIFKIDTLEIEVPIPSVHQKLQDLTGSLEQMRRTGTAFLLGYEGYFITAAEIVPDINTTQKMAIKTQAGLFPALILKKHPQTQLALGRIEASLNIPLPSWHVAIDPQKAENIVLAFDPQSSQSFARPSVQHIRYQGTNPRWFIGSPLFEQQKLVGLLGERNGKLALYSYSEILNMFPELNAADLSARSKSAVAVNSDASLSSPRASFFNPEQHLGAVYVYK